jgi:hypothetical protein
VADVASFESAFLLETGNTEMYEAHGGQVQRDHDICNSGGTSSFNPIRISVNNQKNDVQPNMTGYRSHWTTFQLFNFTLRHHQRNTKKNISL